jgi:hypothetical protein
MDAGARGRLLGLIEMALADAISVQDFCDRFETIYNLELDKSDLRPDEAPVLKAVFDKIVWYSPFPEERAKIPHYIGEEDVKKAVAKAAAALGIARRAGS